MGAWIEIGIFAITIIFFAGIYISEIRTMKKEILDLRDHNNFQDCQIAETRTTSEVILTKLDYIQASIDELKAKQPPIDKI